MNNVWKALVIDDEPAAQRILQRMLQEYSNLISLEGSATNGNTAIAMINEKKPDLLFLDIELNDMSGFDVLKKITVLPHIIFITAFDQYAIKAFEELAIDYLLKPIREERFRLCMEKLKRITKDEKKYDFDALQQLVHMPQKKPTALPVKIGDKIFLIDFDSISYIEADDKYVNIFTDEGKKFLSDVALMKFEEKLPSNFIRVQKSYIINKDKVKELHKYFNSRFIFIMKDKPLSQIKSGLTYYSVIKEEFGL